MNKNILFPAMLIAPVCMAFSGSVQADAISLNQVPVAEIAPSSDLMAEPGGSVLIDVTTSFDPDPLDMISYYGLDLNGDGLVDFFAYPNTLTQYFFSLGASYFLIRTEVLTGALHLGPGNHDIRLTVTDLYGGTAFDTAVITILPSPLFAVPEPGTWGLALAGMGALALTQRRKPGLLADGGDASSGARGG